MEKFTDMMSTKMAAIDEDEEVRGMFMAFDVHCRFSLMLIHSCPCGIVKLSAFKFISFFCYTYFKADSFTWYQQVNIETIQTFITYY